MNNLRYVIPLMIVVWSRGAELKLFAVKGIAGGSSLVVKMDGSVYVNVRARRLDDVVRELRLGRVDFVRLMGRGLN